MPLSPPHDPLDQLCIRAYAPTDQPAVSRLYKEGLLAGQIPAHDTGQDIDSIQTVYFGDDCNHFWVADLGGCALGMIGVLRSSEHTAQIRRLRVDQQWQNTTIPARLVETAVEHCRHHGYLKVVFDTRFDTHNNPAPVVDLFDRLGFLHTRTKNIQDKDLLEFYLDLYRQPQPQPQDHPGAA